MVVPAPSEMDRVMAMVMGGVCRRGLGRRWVRRCRCRFRAVRLQFVRLRIVPVREGGSLVATW